MLGPDINTQIYILPTYTRFMRTQFPGARLDPFWAGIFGPISQFLLCKKHMLDSGPFSHLEFVNLKAVHLLILQYQVQYKRTPSDTLNMMFFMNYVCVTVELVILCSR
jgi:hypothetical protein